MSKRYDDGFLRMCQGVFRDTLTLDSTLHKGFERDYLRLESLIASNGMPVYTIWLPAIDKALCRALDDGFLPILNLPLTGRVNGKSKIPRLFQGIWMKLFEDSGCLKQDIDPTYVVFLRQLLAGASKLWMEAPESALFETTEAFFDVESKIPPPHPIWDGDGSNLSRSELGSLLDLAPRTGDLVGGIQDAPDEKSFLLDVSQRVADVVSTWIGSFDPTQLEFRHGRGATSELPRGKGYKYSFPAWGPRLEWVFPYDECGTSNTSLMGSISCYEPLPPFEEGHSRLIAVPKTQKAPRLIAAEPTAHQWCQQGLLHFLVDRLAEDRCEYRYGPGFSIQFERQDLSGLAALQASRDGRLATVDLKEASDRLSCWLIQRLFRANTPLLAAVIASRTRYLRNDIDKKFPNVIKLRKFATMGSALTFPLQSLSFFILCLASGFVHRAKERGESRVNLRDWRELSKDVRVYGDDLIVPVEWMRELEVLLPLVGLKVNSAKTFKGSAFRESCGIDAFRGYDVTPVKIKTFADTSEPSTVISAIDTCNLLHEKGMWHTADALRSMVTLQNIGVFHVRDDFWGDASFSGERLSHLKVRWSTNLHRKEYLMTQPRAKSRAKHRTEGASNLLQFFIEKPSYTQLRDWKSGLVEVSDAGITRRWVSYEAFEKASDEIKRLRKLLRLIEVTVNETYTDSTDVQTAESYASVWKPLES